MNKSVLLDQLHIDHDADLEPRPRRRRWGLMAAAAAVLLSGAALALLRPDLPRVRVVAPLAASGAAGSLLDASGYVVARRAATVSSKVTGRVAEVLIEEGRRVEAGQVMARLDDGTARAALAEAESQVRAADASLALARIALDQAGPRDARRRHLHDAGFLSDQAVEDSRFAYDTARGSLALAQRQAEVARNARDLAARNLEDTVVRAPFAGVVTVKAAQPGEVVSPISAGGGFTRTGIGTIVDMSSLEVEVDVAESFINRVRPGMPASVQLNAYPEWRIPAEVVAVIPTANRSKATVSVRVAMRARDPRIVPEMGARVAFLGNRRPAAGDRSVIVPPDAVVRTGEDRGVAFAVREGRVRRREIVLGPAEATGLVVQSGLTPQDQVVVGDLSRLRDGQPVRVAPRPATDEEG